MLTRIYTTPGEEIFILNIIKNSLAIDLPKYIILRLAINKSFRLEYKSLDNPLYGRLIPYEGVAKGAEYNMEQVIGDGKSDNKDYTAILRAAFTWRHREENLDFSDDAIFLSAIEKYIHRGLYELYNLYKSKDDFYQFLLDEFGDVFLVNTVQKEIAGEKIDISKFTIYLKSQNIKGQIISSYDALRHDVFKMRFEDIKDYKRIESEVAEYKVKFGLCSDAFTEYANEQMCLNVYFPKPKNLWNKFGANEFEIDIKGYRGKHYLAAYCGRDIKNQPFFFDLKQHLLVAGTSGGGKSKLLHTLIASLALLNKNIKFLLIDPKNGTEFGVYDGASELLWQEVVRDMAQVQDAINSVIEEMKRRYKFLAENGVDKNSDLDNPLDSIVVVIDEVAGAFGQIKTLQDDISLLVQMARAAGIHLVIATQSPNANILKQEFRANFDMRIALKTQNAMGSRIIMDEGGAEKLLGSGDMLVKMDSDITHIFSPLLNPEDIKQILKI